MTGPRPEASPAHDQFLLRHRLPDRSRLWILVYLVVSAALVATFLVARRFTEARFGDFHALTSTAAALAVMVGILTLVRHHSRPNNHLLLIGAGLIGAGILDGYHAWITSSYFVELFPSVPESLAAWSWTTSRLFLSVMLLASWAAGRREAKLGAAGLIEARSIYDDVALLAVVCLGFFIFVPLPPAYQPGWPVHRPQALGIAIVFLLSLVAYLRDGRWRRSPFASWFVLALVVSVLTDALFVAFSAGPSDLMSGVAHGLKIVAYGCILVGVVASTYHLYRSVEETSLELEASNRVLEAEIERRKLAQAELEQAERKVREYAERLKSSNAELEQFAYAASHDLQEPLRVIAGYTRLLASRYEGRLDGQADRFIEYTVSGVERMQKLIQDLLTYSRVETHGKPFERVDSMRAFEWARTNLQAAIEESGASITGEGLPELVAEPTQLGQLFQNLLSNAIKYRSEEAPEVHVRAERTDGAWHFSVADNGIGIPSEDRDRVFEMFRRLDTAGDRDGTGIGLSVCRRIVERHGGRIWVESGPDRGSTFHFTIPDPEPARPDEAP